MCLIPGSNIRMPPPRPEMRDYSALTMTLTTTGSHPSLLKSYTRRNLSLIFVLCHLTVDFSDTVSSRTIEKRFN